jgi:RNA polymerase sigma-70 factor, ECF subfamily
VTEKVLEQELERLFREHYQLMYRTAYSLLGNRADADDVTQTIFLRLLRRGLPENLNSNARRYLYRAAVNVSLDMIRTCRRHPVTDGAEFFATLLENFDSNFEEERHRRLTNALTSFIPRRLRS